MLRRPSPPAALGSACAMGWGDRVPPRHSATLAAVRPPDPVGIHSCGGTSARRHGAAARVTGMERLGLGIGFGLVTGGVLALSAIAFTLQYAVSRIPNLAFGELLTYGAYAGYLASRWTHNLAAAAAAAALTGSVIGWAINAGMIEPFLRARVRTSAIFIGTLAVSLVLQNIILLAFGGTSIAYPLPPEDSQRVGPFIWTPRDEQSLAAALVVMLLLYVLLRHTKFGKALRAIADNRDLARVSGIQAHRIIQLTWGLGGLVAGFAGFVLAVTLGTLTPTFGFTFLLVTMAAAVAGGLGRPQGALVAALLIGIAMEVSALYVDASYKLLIAFGLLVLVLLVRPAGLVAGEGGSAAA